MFRMHVQNGKFITRTVERNKHQLLIGVVEVPNAKRAEVIHAASIDQSFGFYFLSSTFSDEVPPDDSGYPLNIDEYFRKPIWPIMNYDPKMIGVLVRDTELPNASPGHKWVIIASAFKSFLDEDVMVTMKNGEVSVTSSKHFNGMAVSQIVSEPIWGPDEEYSLRLTCRNDQIDQYLNTMSSFRNDDRFNIYKEIMNAVLPSDIRRSFDHVSDYNERKKIARKVLSLMSNFEDNLNSEDVENIIKTINSEKNKPSPTLKSEPM